MTQAMTPKEFAEQCESYDYDIRRASEELSAAKRNKIDFIQTETSKLLGINPGDEVYVFPNQPWPQDKMKVEHFRHCGTNQEGELLFSMFGKRVLRSGSVGKVNASTGYFPLSKANDYKVR